jgi:hypothetical protein
VGFIRKFLSRHRCQSFYTLSVFARADFHYLDLGEDCGVFALVSGAIVATARQRHLNG